MFTIDFINKMYDYENGIVQFKPTKASVLSLEEMLKQPYLILWALILISVRIKDLL